MLQCCGGRETLVLLTNPKRLWPLVAVIWLFSLVAIGLGLRVNNGPEIWLPSGDTEVEYYERFKRHFGSDSYIGLVVSKDKALTLSQQLADLTHIKNLNHPVDSDGSMKDDPLSRQLVGSDGRDVVLQMQLQDNLNPNQVLELLDAVEIIAEGAPLVGTEVITKALNKGSERSFGGLFPVVALVLSGVVYGALRSWRMVLATLFAALTAIAMALGGMGLTGRELNLLVVLMPAILVVLTVAASLHLCYKAQVLSENMPQNDQNQRTGLWLAAVSQTAKPCFLATMTTALGFASLGISEVGPVSDLGIFTAIGSIFVYAAVFTMVPAIVSRRDIPQARQGEAFLGSSYLALISRLRLLILISGIVIVSLASAGLSKLRIESNIMEFFPGSHPLPHAYRDFENAFFGLTSFEVVLDGPLSKLTQPQNYQALDSLADLALTEGLITSAFSPWLSDEERMPEQTAAVVGALLLDIPDDSKSYLWRGGNSAAVRVTFRAPTTSSNAAFESVRRLRQIVEDLNLPKGVSIRISGAAPLLVRGQVLLLDTQVSSFLIALALITLVISLAYRSVRLTVLSLVCNVTPVCCTLGLMGWLQVPLNAGTVTVAGIALGLIVDDTIHIIHGISQNDGKDSRERLLVTLQTAGRPVLITSLALTLGFGLFAVAGFQPTRYFGILTATTALFAVIADLVLLPAIILDSRN